MKYWVGALVALCTASSAVQAATEVRAAVQSITRTSDQSSFRDVQLRAEIWDIQQIWVDKVVTWTDVECDFAPSNPERYWNGFFEARSRDEKVRLLAAAVKGIGESRARDIVYADRGYFSRPPRHWNAFVDEIFRIEDDLRLKGLINDVLVKYGAENRRALGYSYSGGGYYGSGQYVAPQGITQNATSGGDAWHGFFNVPKADKPAALSEAIRGIGVSTAEKIVDCGGFKSKPRSWEDFKDEIDRIERSCGINGLRDNVIAKYGSSNKENLYGGGSSGGDNGGGNYNPPSNGGGNYNPPAPPQVICREIPRSRTISVLVEQPTFIRALTKSVDVFFENSVLLSDEKETITLRWDGSSEEVQIDRSQCVNSYGLRVDARGSAYVLTGQGRKKVRPSLQDFSTSFKQKNGKLTLTVSDKRAEELIRLSNASYSLVVSYTLVKKGGTCSSDKNVVSTTKTLGSGSGEIVVEEGLAEAPAQGDSYFLKDVTFERLNTDFFSQSSGAWTSDAVKVQ